MSRRDVFAALGPIYDAATDSGRWLGALDALNEAVGGHATALLVRERDDPLVPYEVSAMSSRYKAWFDSGRADHYFTHLHHHEAFDFETVKRIPVHELLHDINMGTEREVIDHRPDYVHLREEVGVRRRIGVRLNENKAWFDMVAIGFHQRHLLAPASAFELIPPLVPHLTKVVQPWRAFTILRSRYQAVLAVLDRVHVGLAIALASGELIVRNAEAERILGLGDGLMLSAGNRLIGRDPVLAPRVAAAILEASNTARGEGDRPESLMVCQRPSGLHSFLIEVAPLADSAGELGHELRGAVVTLIDPAAAPDIDLKRFARLHKLTRAEAEVCTLMVQGLTGATIAEMRDTSLETVRSQMAAVLAKTGTHRRADLIRLAVRTLPPVG
jgi:DNA-binding CsgD family transcriptional regulator